MLGGVKGAATGRLGIGLVAVLLFVSGCGQPAHHAPPASDSGTATFALPPGFGPGYIYPLMSGAEASNPTLYYFQQLLYHPLYWLGEDGQVGVNYQDSIGGPPVYSNGGKTVTITLNHYVWSDGQPVTNRDVSFFMNLLDADRTSFWDYVPGAFPDNVTSMSFPTTTPDEFSITFNRAYNHLWLLYNELSQITPLPQHAWDREAPDGPIGNYDLTASGATAVNTFLTAQANHLATYATNPLWKVVDGAWKLSLYDSTTSFTEFVPNPSFAGSNKPHLAKVELLPYTSDQAEFNALRSGALDYGYLPYQDLSERAYFKKLSYRFSPWTDEGISFIVPNYNAPVAGPILKQLYIRQAMQHLINQPGLIRTSLHGFGHPTYGPVPTEPLSAWVSAAERRNPYPYSVQAAIALLKDHGWSIHPGGVDSCIKPGSGPGECGNEIARGATLNFTEQYASGVASFAAIVQVIKSAWSQAGINVVITSAPAETVTTSAYTCASDPNECSFDLENWADSGSAWTFAYYPTGEDIFKTGAGSNFDNYSNTTADADIGATTEQPGYGPLYAYESYLAKQLPALWEPAWPEQLTEVSSKLHGALPQDPFLHIYPESWSLSK